MEEFEKFDQWIYALWLDWNFKGEINPIPIWLKAREDAAFCWAWNCAARKLATVEKKKPLDEVETRYLDHLEITVEVVLTGTLIRHDESSDEFWACHRCVDADFQLLARAARLHHSDSFLEKLREEYDAGRFPHSIF